MDASSTTATAEVLPIDFSRDWLTERVCWAQSGRIAQRLKHSRIAQFWRVNLRECRRRSIEMIML